MSSPLPTRIDPWRAAHSGAVYAGRLALDALPRLAEAVLGLGDSDGQPEVAYRLCFERTSEGVFLAHGRVEGVLLLPCQRCLEPVAFTVKADLALALLRSEQAIEQLDPALDPILIDEDRVSALEWIEDELLLAIPAIPRHAQGDCEAPVLEADAPEMCMESEPATRHPFAALAALREKGG